MENRNHHKRGDSVWQEGRQRHLRPRVAQNLALTRNALLAINPILTTCPQIRTFQPNALGLYL